MKNTNVLLSVTDLEKYFPLRKKNPFSKQRQYLRANDGISLTIFKGETFGLVGESGCGKSTFGRTILQLQKPTRGQVTYYGRGAGMELTQLKGREMRSLRKDLQIIFQFARLREVTLEAYILVCVSKRGVGLSATFQILLRLQF